jgi:hypothetical protein
VSDKTWEFAQQENVKSIVLSDAQAAMACVRLAAEEKIIVEPACGVSVAACYQEVLRGIVPNFNKSSKVVIIVCGGKSLPQLYLTRDLLQLSVLGLLLKWSGRNFVPGSNISVETLVEYQKQYSGKKQARIYSNGH